MNSALEYLRDNWDRLDIDQRLGSRPSSLLLTPRFRASRHVVFILFPEGASRPALVVKIPRLLDGDPSLAREAANLRAAQALRPEGLRSVPRLVAYDEHRGRPMLVETALDGTLMSPDVVRRHSKRCSRMLTDWLLDFERLGATPGDASWFERLAESPLERFAATFALSSDEQALIDRTRAWIAPLRAAELPYVFEHGDLSHPNLILRGDDSLGVVDWELADAKGLPASDLFVFLAYVAFSIARARTLRDHLSAFERAFFGQSASAAPTLRLYADRWNLSAGMLRQLFVLCWARRTATLLSRIADSAPQGSGATTRTIEWLRTNRYYQMWRHAASDAHRLVP